MDIKIFFNRLIFYILTLYGDPTIPRKIVQDFIDYMINLLDSLLLPQLQNDMQILLSSNVPDSVCKKVKNGFKQYTDILEPFSTEAKRFSILKKKDILNPKSL